MKRFGFDKFKPKPKTDKDWTRIWNRNKLQIPTVKKLTLNLSSKGPGQTGARHFKAYAIPPIKHWNPNVEIIVNHTLEAPVEPELLVEKLSGETTKLDLKGVHLDQIKANLLLVESGKPIPVSTTTTASAPL